MDLINKINNSRKIFKKYLELEWDVSKISDYSNEEIEKLYTMKSDNNSLYFGKASNLNMTLNHKNIKDHKLHIIYYNFPELNSPPLKVTKTCGDKILSLYTNELINPEDSIILIITEKISENIEKTIEDVYKKGQEKLIIEGISDNINEQNMKLDKKYKREHFRNIHLFNINTLGFDIGLHNSVPKHNCIRFKDDIKEILKNVNANDQQLPIILRTDPMAKLLRLSPGDLCEITRVSERTGEYKFYRICN